MFEQQQLRIKMFDGRAFNLKAFPSHCMQTHSVARIVHQLADMPPVSKGTRHASGPKCVEAIGVLYNLALYRHDLRVGTRTAEGRARHYIRDRASNLLALSHPSQPFISDSRTLLAIATV